jgi:hypothetical protein
VQLRFECSLTGGEYVNQRAWREASLPRCPLHPKGGCGFARHGTYKRISPPGTLIARWYCPQGHRTFSLLPDCLAARLTGTLAEVESVVESNYPDFEIVWFGHIGDGNVHLNILKPDDLAMDVFQQRCGGTPPDFFVSRTDIHDPLLIDVEEPKDFANVLGDGSQALFTLP